MEYDDSPNRRKPGEHEWGQTRYTKESFEACKRAKQIRVYRMASEEAAGPVFARAQQKRLLAPEGTEEEEDFCLQVDAHTLFTKGWDNHLLKEWSQTNNEYAILTTYPTGANELPADGSLPNINNHWEMPHLCDAELFGKGMVRNAQAGAAANLVTPALCKLWAAGLSFSRCHAERLVPADPMLKHIFMGEEFARGARLWTHGYDFYTMTRPSIGTWYGGDKGNTDGWQEVESEREIAHARVATLLQTPDSDQSPEAIGAMKGYLLGKRRSFSDYIKLTGVDTVQHKYTHTSCLVDRWQPWLDDAPKPLEALVTSKKQKTKESHSVKVPDAKSSFSKKPEQTLPQLESSMNPIISPPVQQATASLREHHQHHVDDLSAYFLVVLLAAVLILVVAKFIRRFRGKSKI